MATHQRTAHPLGSDLPEQLALLPSAEVPLQFRLDQRTRQRGLEQVARIRQQLAARAADRQDVTRIVTPSTASRRPATGRRAA